MRLRASRNLHVLVTLKQRSASASRGITMMHSNPDEIFPALHIKGFLGIFAYPWRAWRNNDLELPDMRISYLSNIETSNQ
jgi:hypothetical protein